MAIMSKLICFLILLVFCLEFNLSEASDDVLSIDTVKLKIPYLTQEMKNCDLQKDQIHCFFKNADMLLITVSAREVGDDYPLYVNVLKNKIFNLPLVSKPLKNDRIRHKNRQWVFSQHHNAEILDHITSYYLTIVGGKVLLVSYTSKVPGSHENFRLKHFEGIDIL